MLPPAILQPLRPCLLSLELVELDEQIVDVLKVLKFVQPFEAIQESYPAYEEDMDAYLDLSVEEADCLGLVMFFVEELEVDVSKVYHQEVYTILAVFFKLFQHFLLVFLLGVHLSLAEVELSVEISWQILYFFNFSPHPYLDYEELFLLDEEIRVVRVK